MDALERAGAVRASRSLQKPRRIACGTSSTNNCDAGAPGRRARGLSAGWTSIKLYFMIGHPRRRWPTSRLSRICPNRSCALASPKSAGGRGAVGVSTLVPKPHTPSSGCQPRGGHHSGPTGLLERELRDPGCPELEQPAGDLAGSRALPGDRRLAGVIRLAWELGARFDAWGDQFAPTAWFRAFEANNLDAEWYARRAPSIDEALPGSHRVG